MTGLTGFLFFLAAISVIGVIFFLFVAFFADDGAMIGVIIFLVLAVVFSVLGYNGLKITCGNRFYSLSSKVEEAKTQVGVFETRREELKKELLSIVKQYAKHEKGILDNLVRMRDYSHAAFLFVIERYPNLKADAHFMQLMGEYKELCDSYVTRKTSYNNLTREYNAMVKIWPSRHFIPEDLPHHYEFMK